VPQRITVQAHSARWAATTHSADRAGHSVAELDLAGLFPPGLQRLPELGVGIGPRDQHLGQDQNPPLIIRNPLQRCQLGHTIR